MLINFVFCRKMSRLLRNQPFSFERWLHLLRYLIAWKQSIVLNFLIVQLHPS